MQEKYVHWLQGAAAGAVALAVVGFSWGGWSTSSGTAKQVEAAVLTAMVPACVKEVMADPTAAAELKVKRASDYDDRRITATCWPECPGAHQPKADRRK